MASEAQQPGSGEPGSGSPGEGQVNPASRDDLPTSAHPPSGPVLAPSDVLGESPGEVLGNYQLVRVLGEGGFGVVWLALQREPLVRQVALKILKPGMDSKQVLARFEQERQALALMDHPNVARVFEAGATPRGRPYFVMELVRGVPITTYADEKKLNIAQRLDLFVTVCEAIQHAHTKGIIHRDIKPSNVLVEELDGKPEVKVIDFGVAKAIEHALTDKTLFTETGQIVGTPEYMSPEQADADHRAVDTRTDVYSLGVLLYELLTGALPFDPSTLRSAGYKEIQRIIREVDPPKPSSRVSAQSPDSSLAANNRRTDAGGLSGELRRELEWIPLKAMRKEADARYQSAADLARDVRAYLMGQPLAAGPESQMYRARKFVRRHRAGVAAATALLIMCLVAVGALIFGVLQYRVALEQSQRAEAESLKAIEALKAADAETRRSLVRVTRTQEVLEELLSLADPTADRRLLGGDTHPGQDVTVREVLDATARRLDGGQLAKEPLIEGDVRITCADAYSNLGDSKTGVVQAKRAVEVFRAAEPHDALRLAIALSTLGKAHLVAGETAPARAALDEAAQVLDSVPDASANWKARIQILRARLLDVEGQHGEARQLYQTALAELERSSGSGAPQNRAAEIGFLLGVSALHSGEIEDSLPLLKSADQAYSRLYGARSSQRLSALIQYGHALMQSRDVESAEAAFRDGVEIARELFPKGSPKRADAEQALGRLLMQSSRLDEAEPLLRAALDFRRSTPSTNSQDLAQGLDDLGFILRARGKPADALDAYREALAIHRQKDGGDTLASAPILVAIADTLVQIGKPDEALPLAQQAVKLRSEGLPKGHWSTGTAKSVLGAVLLALNRPKEAEVELVDAVSILTKNHGGSPARLATARERLERAQKAVSADPNSSSNP